MLFLFELGVGHKRWIKFYICILSKDIRVFLFFESLQCTLGDIGTYHILGINIARGVEQVSDG